MKTILILILLALAGCGGMDTTTSGTGGTSSTGSGGTDAGGSGGAPTTSSASTGTGGDGGEACATTPNTSYPALLSYNPGAQLAGPLAPLLDRTPEGAAAGRFGPTATGSVSKWIGVLSTDSGCELPDPVTFAIWTEPLCGLPTKTPPWQTAPLAEFAQEEAAFGAVRLAHPLPPVTLGGDSGFSALKLTTATTCAVAFECVGECDPSRAIWLGRVDNDGDGVTDDALGWATLAEPTDPSVAPYPYDLGLGAE